MSNVYCLMRITDSHYWYFNMTYIPTEPEKLRVVTKGKVQSDKRVYGLRGNM
jgi:hypothetical protein